MSQKNRPASELNHSETVFSAKWTKNRHLVQVVFLCRVTAPLVGTCPKWRLLVQVQTSRNALQDHVNCVGISKPRASSTVHGAS